MKDIEYLLNDLDDYYRPILAKQPFDGGYEFYTCRGDKDKKLQLKEYIAMIIPYITLLIDEKKSNNQKVQLDIGINLKHLDSSKNYTTYIKSKNVEALPGDDTNNITSELLDSLYENYDDLVPRNGSGYSFDSVEMLGIHFHKIEVKRGSSYIESPEWLKNKGATINPKNTKDNRCLLYAITIALNHEEIGKDPQRISKLIPHIHKYNWDDIDFPAGKNEWKTFERNNKDIALNILSVPYNITHDHR